MRDKRAVTGRRQERGPGITSSEIPVGRLNLHACGDNGGIKLSGCNILQDDFPKGGLVNKVAIVIAGDGEELDPGALQPVGQLCGKSIEEPLGSVILNRFARVGNVAGDGDDTKTGLNEEGSYGGGKLVNTKQCRIGSRVLSEVKVA